MTTQGLERELELARRLALEAGRAILEVYATAFGVRHKPHGAGPVTLADERANALIFEGLRSAFPEDGIVAEESVDPTEVRRSSRCWFVDPLDGTQEFVERNGMFAVQIGLSVDGVPRLGVVFVPVSGKLYSGVVGGECVLEAPGGRRPLRVSKVSDPKAMRLVVSRSHRSQATELLRGALGISSVREHGSVGLKCGLLAEGAADLYVHPGSRSWRWDSCGPEAILRGAGGVLTDFAGEPYRYDSDELQNRRGILACSAVAFPVVLPVAQRIARESGFVQG